MTVARDRSAIGLARELTKGTPTIPTKYIPFTGDPVPVDMIKDLWDQGVRGSMVEDYGYLQGPRWGLFDWQGDAFPDSLNLPLLALLGDYTFSAGTLNTHTHSVLNSGSGQPPSISITDFSGATNRTFPGCQLSELAFKFGAEGLLGYTAKAVGFVAQVTRSVSDGVTTSASPTVTSATAAFTSADLFKPISGAGIPASSFIGVVNSATSIGLSSSNTVNTPVNATATASGVTLTIGIVTAPAYSAVPPAQSWVGLLQVAGVTNLRIAEGELTISRKSVDPLHNIDAAQGPYAIFSAPLKCAGKITFYYEADEAELLYYVNNTQPSLDLNFVEPGAGTLAKAIRFHMSQAAFKLNKIRRGKAFVVTEAEFAGVANTTDAGTSGGFSPVKVTLLNTDGTL